MTEQKKLYSVLWPTAERHRTESVSGVMVEVNLHQQLAFHFYNEVRELEKMVTYNEEGNSLNTPREANYLRQVVQTILLSETAALGLRDVLNIMYPPRSSETLS
ncbi:MAG: hypothetical protein OEW39_09130 [Deltaproteobacteria bacterium]|nr:hypothetical protein [Deltaproteobacteria bacterium]